MVSPPSPHQLSSSLASPLVSSLSSSKMPELWLLLPPPVVLSEPGRNERPVLGEWGTMDPPKVVKEMIRGWCPALLPKARESQ